MKEGTRAWSADWVWAAKVARLWWKEWRLQGTLSVAVLLGTLLFAVILGGVAHGLGADAERQQGVGLVLLAGAALHAGGVGAALFASEREAGTLIFHQRLPVSAETLVVAKLSYGVTSTLAVSLLLYGAELVLHEWSLATAVDAPATLWIGATFLFAATASAWLRHAVGSAVLGLVSSAAVVFGFVAYLDSSGRDRWAQGEGWSWSIGLGVAAAAVGGVGVTLAALRRELAPRRLSPHTDSQLFATSSEFSWHRRLRPLGRLIWQSVRETRFQVLWLSGALIFLTLAAPAFALLLAPMTLVAGVLCDQEDKRGDARRRLAWLGVSPGTLWFARRATWLAVVGATLAILMLYSRGVVRSMRPHANLDVYRAELLAFRIQSVGLTLGLFAIGQWCSQTIPRALTGIVVGVLLLVGWLFWLSLMSDAGVSLWWFGGAAPATLLLATWWGRREFLLGEPSVARQVGRLLWPVPLLLLAIVGQRANALIEPPSRGAWPTPRVAMADATPSNRLMSIGARLSGPPLDSPESLTLLDEAEQLVEAARGRMLWGAGRIPAGGDLDRLQVVQSRLVLDGRMRLGMDEQGQPIGPADFAGSWRRLEAALRMSIQLRRCGRAVDHLRADAWERDTLKWVSAWGRLLSDPCQLFVAEEFVRDELLHAPGPESLLAWDSLRLEEFSRELDEGELGPDWYNSPLEALLAPRLRWFPGEARRSRRMANWTLELEARSLLDSARGTWQLAARLDAAEFRGQLQRTLFSDFWVRRLELVDARVHEARKLDAERYRVLELLKVRREANDDGMD